MSELEMMLFGTPYPIKPEIVRVVIDATDQQEKLKRKSRAEEIIDYMTGASGKVCVIEMASAIGISANNARGAISSLKKAGKVKVMYMRYKNSRCMFAELLGVKK